MPKTLTTEDFINRANKIHNNFYNYSHVVYTNMHTKVKIIDPDLGEFWQSPLGHIGQKQGHPGRRYTKMAAKRRKPIETFIQQAQEKHGNLYDYSKVEYVNTDTKVCIIDPEYGEFWQSPYQHLNSHGCPARTAEKHWMIHIDHIIPLSIICSRKKKYNDWSKNRPLYKFLNSDINLHKVTAKFNNDKNDHVIIHNKQVTASSIRNNYLAIGYLIRTQLDVDPTDIINQDKQYVQNYFGL
jgi:hypothetical protein